jgi:RimJ/RimL family protein N-acetyltransferase
MLKGAKVGLRARHEDDIPILRTELHGDVLGSSRANGEPWRPLTDGGSKPPFVVDDEDRTNVQFSVVDLAEGELVGTAQLWAVDLHNRTAHIGLGLRPGARGKGYGTDTVAVLCHYGFLVRGLNRLQIETLTDNTAMLRSAERNGFTRDGLLRSSAFVMGEFLDEVVLGLLAADWKDAAR